MKKQKIAACILLLGCVGCKLELKKSIYSSCVPTQETRVIVDKKFASHRNGAGIPEHQRKHKCTTEDKQTVYEWMPDWVDGTTTEE